VQRDCQDKTGGKTRKRVIKRLIINADDFGLTCGVNRGIAEACSSGVVTSVTLMEGGKKCEQALELARSTMGLLPKRISIGCHVVLVDGSPTLPASSVESLLGDNSHGPRFRKTFSSFSRGAMLGSFDPGELECEIRAQITGLQRAGLSLSHADTHKHAHLFPSIFGPFLRAVKSCGVRAVRNPFYPLRHPTIRQIQQRPRIARRFVQIPLLRSFARRFQSAVEAAGLVTPDGCIGVYAQCFQSYSQMEDILRALPQGTWELVCHPGYNDAELDLVTTSLRKQREVELGMLTSSRTREMLQQYGIELASYWDLHDRLEPSTHVTS
jgi:predicted glycoside hydrolase/deacetylase ChbG (UPF0249 family)